MGENRAAKRHRWRLPCELVFEGGRQRAFVLDLSETGLFVQTRAQLRPGAAVEVRLAIDATAPPLALACHVARTKQVPSQLTSVAHGGIGLVLTRAPKAYVDALAALQGRGALRTRSASESPAPAAKGQRFYVRVQQHDGPRSRTVEVAASSVEQARAVALREVGDGWDVVRVDAIAR